MQLSIILAEGGFDSSFIIMLVLMFGVMYLFMIRPQMKKRKEEEAFVLELKKGTRIVTSGGIHGKIAEVKDDTFIIDIEAGGRLKIYKSAVSLDNSKLLNK